MMSCTEGEVVGWVAGTWAKAIDEKRRRNEQRTIVVERGGMVPFVNGRLGEWGYTPWLQKHEIYELGYDWDMGRVQLDLRTYERALSCVHCGLCLPVCPTYLETGLEAEGPRGRIQLMRGVSDGNISPTAAVRGHLDSCLDCRACETACPSNVIYHELIEETRQKLPRKRAAWWIEFLVRHVLPYPARLKMAMAPARLLQRMGLWGIFARVNLLGMLSEDGTIWPRRLPRKTGKSGGKLRVGFFEGCVGSALFSEVNRKSVELLAACGVEVIVPRGHGCCGALHHHDGNAQAAQKMARRNIEAFAREGNLDFIVSAVAGCGAMLKEYGLLLRDDPGYAAKAREFEGKARDICQVLGELELPRMVGNINATVTYHDACHLAHAQKVTSAPRRLLAKIPGITLVELPESDLCCGAAGTYNLSEPQMARELAARKLKNITSTGAGIVAVGNAGCALHLRAQANAKGEKIRIVHPVELLHQAVLGTP
jgi:glycolate oxidase iron-sulfur subunit